MTLPELLVSVALMGLLVTVISSAIIVTLRQNDSTEGRLNLSAAEQSIGMWLPNDLASAAEYTKNPGASPCGAPVCDGIDLSNGSNVLMLTWTIDTATPTGVTSVTKNVSYHFSPSDDGESFVLRRVECVETGGGWACDSLTLIGEFPGPPAGISWAPGVANGDQCEQAGGPAECTVPDWVIEVSVPLRADATSDATENYATGDQIKDANRVIVTIDGGSGGDTGSSGGQTKVSITAGGTNREIIDASSLLGAPSFVEARSRCGGPLTLIVDESLSIQIAGASNAVLNAVRTFTETLVGTPVQLQIVEFERQSKALGSGSDWNRYFDMTDIDGDVRTLVGNGGGDAGLLGTMVIGDNNGDTNWEEGFFRTFYNSNATISDEYPETVVFFTDGTPTADRQMGSSYKTGSDLAGQPSYPRPPYDNYSPGQYNQASFNRANYLAAEHRSKVRLIGVGVGGVNDNITWVTSPGTGYVYQWQRGYRRYKQVETGTVYEKAASLSSDLDFEYYRNSWWSSGWRNTSPDYYFENNNSSHTSQSQGSDDVRIESGNNYSDGAWDSISYQHVANNLNLSSILGIGPWFRVDSWTGDQGQAAYDAAPAAEKAAGLWRTRTATVERWVAADEYNANNNPAAVPADSDGWVDAGKQWVSKDADAIEWEDISTPSSVSPTNPNDGYRRNESTPVTPPPGGYDGYTPEQTGTKTGAQILANLVAGDDTGTPYISSPDNSQIANMYILPPANQGGFSQLQGALKAVALGECGGTVTIRTQLESGSVVRDPVTYQNGAVWTSSGSNWNDTGDAMTIEPSVITTNQQYPTGTFDFEIPGGTEVKVLVSPQNFAELDSYAPVGWSCRAGITPLTQGVDYGVVPVLDDDDNPTGWSSIQVNVSANEAIACTQTVRAVG